MRTDSTGAVCRKDTGDFNEQYGIAGIIHDKSAGEYGTKYGTGGIGRETDLHLLIRLHFDNRILLILQDV